MFAPLVLAMVAAFVFARSLAALNRQLDLKDGEMTRILLAGDGRLHELGVHPLVWKIRLLWAIDTACILAFVYLLLNRAEAV